MGRRAKKESEDTRTDWQKSRDAMLDETSRKYAIEARVAFREVEAAQLAAVAKELRTRRQALDSMRRSYEKLRAEYLRVPATTYDGWLEHGPHADWEEVLAATKDDAVWDRLVERGAPEVSRGR